MDWRSMPVLRNDHLLFQDTSGRPAPHAIVPCLLCTKPFQMRPFIGDPDQICPDCWKTYADCATVLCVVCKVTICKLIPKVLDTGYYIQPRSVLHSDKCSICSPGLAMSTVIEIQAWENSYGRKKKIISIPTIRR